MNKHIGITIFLLVLITVFAVHILNTRSESARLDLTQTGLYSLTEGSHQILDKMVHDGVKPIEIKLYFSLTAGKSLPKFIKNFITYENYMRNLLKEYRRYSNGKINISFIDPVPDSDDAQDAADYGLDGKPINQHGDIFYFGLVFETQTGSKSVIDFLWPEKQETIEYEISKNIYNLLWPSKKKIGIMSGIDPLPEDNPYMAQLMAAQGKQPQEAWLSMKVLQEQYTVTTIDRDADHIAHEDYDLVLVIHPRSFGDKQLWALDEWIVTGGNTIVFLDPYSIMDRPPQNPNQPWAALQYEASSNLEKLMDKWGISRPAHKFAADYELAVKRPVERGGLPVKVITDLMISEDTRAATLNGESPIFQGLNNLRFYLPGYLEINSAPAESDQKSAETETGQPLTITPLITTTVAGGTLEFKPGFGGNGDELAYTDFQNASKMLDQYRAGDKKLNLALSLQGKFESAFPEGATFPATTPETPPGMPAGFQMPPDENAEMITKPAVAEENLKNAAVLVFADVDFITDPLAFQQSIFGVQATNDNYKVLLNSVDFLLGARELMNVRSKKFIRRPFDLFDKIEAEADQKVLDQERAIRANIERFQEELREKQGGLNQGNAVLFQKKVQDEIDSLNEKINEGNRELQEIRKAKRAALEVQEAKVTRWITLYMPILVCIGGLIAYFQRRSKQKSFRMR